MCSRAPIAFFLLTLLGAPAWAGSSNSLLDVSSDGKRLLVVNSDNGSVTVVDTAERKALREIIVGDKPEGAAWIGDGPLAAVTVCARGPMRGQAGCRRGAPRGTMPGVRPSG